MSIDCFQDISQLRAAPGRTATTAGPEGRSTAAARDANFPGNLYGLYGPEEEENLLCINNCELA